MKTRPVVLLICALVLTLMSILPCYAESIPIKDVFSTYYPSSQVLVENDDYIVFSVDYAETSQGNSAIPEDMTVIANPYKVVILFELQNDMPVMCLYIPVNADGTLPKGDNPNIADGIALISPEFLFQSMTSTQ